MVIAIFFLFGIVLGSFLNVCIARIPESQSIISPRSRCPHCHEPIKAYDNVPVLSWLLLGGKCRNCKARISVQYPLVELLTGLLFAACYANFGVSVFTAKWVVFTCLIIVLTITDYLVRLLPDAVNFFGIGLGLAFAVRVPPEDEFVKQLMEQFTRLAPSSPVVGVANALLGGLLGSLLLLGAAKLYKLVRKREGMGMGDVKMMAMAGTFLGIRGAFLTILMGSLFGSLLGLAAVLTMYFAGWKRAVAVRASRRGLGSVTELRWAIASSYQLPFGTFLGLGALLYVHFDSWIGMTIARTLR